MRTFVCALGLLVLLPACRQVRCSAIDRQIAPPAEEAASLDMLIAPRYPPPPVLFDPEEFDEPYEGPLYRIELRVTDRERLLTAPIIDIKPGGRATLNITSQKSFIQDIDVERAGNRFIADPVVGVLQEGVVIELCAAPDPNDASTSWIAVHVTEADLREPIRTFRVRTHARAHPATVQLPRIGVRSTAGLRRVPHGQEFHLTDLRGEQGPVAVFATLTPAGDVSAVSWSPKPEEAPPQDEASSTGLGQVHHARAVDAMLHDVISGSHPPRAIHVELFERGQTVHTFKLASASVEGVVDQSIEQRAYVQDFDTVKKGGPADPVIGTIQDGFSASLTRVDGRLHLEFIWAELVEPVQTFQTNIARGHRVAIELPELRLQQVRIDLETGKVSHGVGGGTPPPPVDWSTGGPVTLPIGKLIRKGRGGDEVHHLWARIEIRDAS